MLMETVFNHLNRHKLLLQFILISTILLVITTMFQDEFYSGIVYRNYIATHLIIEMFIVLFSLAIAVQTLLGAKFNPNRRVILFGALFLIVGVLELFHMLTYSGMPFFIKEHNPNLSLWLSIIPRLFFAVGSIIIFSLKEQSSSDITRVASYLISGIITILTIVLIYNTNVPLATLFTTSGEPTILRNSLYITLIILEFLAIFILIRQEKKIPEEAATFIAAFLYLIASDVLFLNYNEFFDVYIFLAHVLHLLAFVLLFGAIYYSQIRNPFSELTKAHASLAESENKIRRMAFYDSKTLLPNEESLKEDLAKILNINSNRMALLIFGIQRYDSVRASLGKELAQHLINMVSERISCQLDGKFPLYKLNEERFAIFIHTYDKKADLLSLSNNLQKAMNDPFIINHFSISTPIYIGISIYPEDTKKDSELIEFATFASYEAQKVNHRLAFYTLELQRIRENRILLENDLKVAINGQLFLEYQPQLDLQTGEIVSLEALIRWRHPVRGLISPLEFISIAEESGLIIPIGHWVLETACRETVELRQKTGRDISVAVNLSMGQLFQEDFVQSVETVLQKTGLAPSSLQLEITESMTVNTGEIIPILQRLKNIGISIAVDDFGTEYSSLSYLKDFPVDVLKIDRIFIQHILEKEKDIVLVKMILSMAKLLQLKVVAEGIESREQLHCLIKHECDIIQGFYISRPLPMAKFIESLDSLQSFAKGSMISNT